MSPARTYRAPTPANPEAGRRSTPPRRAWLLLAALALHGCASGPQSGKDSAAAGGAAGSGAGAAGRDAARTAGRGQNPLTVERDWLRTWFDGTPVLIAQNGDGALSVEVPLAFSFEPRRSAVKPALAAVLDKLAESLRRSGALLAGLAAPPDPAGPPALALQRATALRAHLLSRGVPLVQLGAPAAASTATVQLRAELPPL
jgi:outer membrane protein OmpA-like peptidoglycan-associated protein